MNHPLKGAASALSSLKPVREEGACPVRAILAAPFGRHLRSDGAQARERLLAEALRLFSEHGFAQTSTRAIAQAAGVNISAISYYFGDKQGLYRSAFSEPFSGRDPQQTIAEFNAAGLPLEKALRLFFTQLLAPLEQGETMQHCLRLHMREMLEPTGLWQQEIEQQIRPLYHGLWELLCRHLGLAQADEGVHRLSLALVGLPIYLIAAQDVVQAVCPHVLQQPHAVPRSIDHMVRYAVALVQAEAAARNGAAASASLSSFSSTLPGACS